MKIKRKHGSYLIPLFSTSDIAFLLLIFIMLVSLMNYRKEVTIKYAEAKTAVKTSQDTGNLEIWVDREGDLYLNGNYCHLEEIESGIIEAYIHDPDTRVHIIADRDTEFRNVQKVLQILQILQYRTVSLVVKAL